MQQSSNVEKVHEMSMKLSQNRQNIAEAARCQFQWIPATANMAFVRELGDLASPE
jgi:hypothetical protein